jgi:heptose I phosphotransferase
MSDTVWQRLFRGVRRVRERSDWSRFAGPDWIDRIMGLPVTDRFHAKQGRSTGRWIVQKPEGSLTVYLKRHYQLPWWRGVLAAVWPNAGWSPALQEWRRLEWARSQGMPVPEAVAAGEYIGPWGRLQSFLVVEELTDMLPLHEAIPAACAALQPGAFLQWKRGLIAEMARLVRGLHARRHFHKDLYLCHFYIHRDDTVSAPPWPGRVHLIDLHRLGHHALTWRIWRLKDLAQLLYSSDVPGVNRGDRLRWWKLYLGAGHRTWMAGLLRQCVMIKWRRYQRHNARRP